MTYVDQRTLPPFLSQHLGTPLGLPSPGDSTHDLEVGTTVKLDQLGALVANLNGVSFKTPLILRNVTDSERSYIHRDALCAC